MGYHVVMKKKYLDTKYMPLFNTSTLPSSNIACFYTFPSMGSRMLSTKTNLYTGLVLNKKAGDLIEDFNKRFQNMKITVKFTKNISEYVDLGKATTEWMEGWRTDKEDLAIYILTTSVSKDYTSSSKYHTYVPLIQFVRTYSPMARYRYHYRMACSVLPTVPDLLEGINHYNYRSEYGSWCNSPVSLDEFMCLDNPDMVNKASSGQSKHDYYGTSLFRELRKVKEVIV